MSVYQIRSTVEKVSQRSAVARGNASDALAGCIRLVNVSFLEQKAQQTEAQQTEMLMHVAHVHVRTLKELQI